MNIHFRRFRPDPATPLPRTRHNGAPSAQVPQPPHAAPVPTPTPTDAFAGVHRLRLDWPAWLREQAAKKRAEGADLNSKVQDTLALITRCYDEADDMEAIAAMIEADEIAALALEARPEPRNLAAATGALFNGWQPDLAPEQSHDASAENLPRRVATAAEIAAMRDTLTLPQVQGAAR